MSDFFISNFDTRRLFCTPRGSVLETSSGPRFVHVTFPPEFADGHRVFDVQLQTPRDGGKPFLKFFSIDAAVLTYCRNHVSDVRVGTVDCISACDMSRATISTVVQNYHSVVFGAEPYTPLNSQSVIADPAPGVHSMSVTRGECADVFYLNEMRARTQHPPTLPQQRLRVVTLAESLYLQRRFQSQSTLTLNVCFDRGYRQWRLDPHEVGA